MKYMDCMCICTIHVHLYIIENLILDEREFLKLTD